MLKSESQNSIRKYTIIDYETRSEAPLRKVGAFEYAKHPSTRVMCVGWRTGTKKELAQQLSAKKLWADQHPHEPKRNNPYRAKIWSPAFEKNIPTELIELLKDPEIILVAHNALFEQSITRFQLKHHLPPERWECTASRTAALALPRALGDACLALKLPFQKDKEGHRLMMKLSKPRKPTKKDKSKWHSKVTDLLRVMDYCCDDVDAETMIHLTVPHLAENERKIWLLDQKMNCRGINVDRVMILAVLKMIEEEKTHLNKETDVMTLGELVSTTQRDGVLEWLESEGVFLPNLQAKTVKDAINEGLVEGHTKRMLEIRQAISKTSTAKYHAFEMRTRTDGRLRDFLVYHGASTGRFNSGGVQALNLPKGNLADSVQAAEIMCEGDLELIRLLYGDPMTAFSSCLRPVLKAPPGKEFFCADFPAIEARGLFWMARYDEGCAAFMNDEPMYEQMGAVIFDVDLEELKRKVKLEDPVAVSQRWVGKQTILGCGYGMGDKKFVAQCKKYGVPVTDEVAQAAVRAYRDTHWPVPKLWSNIERAAIAAVKAPGKKFKINRTAWWVEGQFLWCELPSGRRLAYYGPEIRTELTPWKEKRPVLYHWGIHPYTRKWVIGGTYGGRLVENVVQAVCRDLLAEAMLRVEGAGYDVNLPVHDEILAERVMGEGKLEEFLGLMSALPKWAEGFPLKKVGGWKGPRYRK